MQTGRRPFLFLAVASAASLAVPALGRDPAKPRPAETVSAPEDLMREHAVLDRLRADFLDCGSIASICLIKSRIVLLPVILENHHERVTVLHEQKVH